MKLLYKLVKFLHNEKYKGNYSISFVNRVIQKLYCLKFQQTIRIGFSNFFW